MIDTCEKLIPEWSNSVEGIVDSEDLLVNISCETLHQHKVLRVPKKNTGKNCLAMFAEVFEKTRIIT